jgi:hypothetical protein
MTNPDDFPLIQALRDPYPTLDIRAKNAYRPGHDPASLSLVGWLMAAVNGPAEKTDLKILIAGSLLNWVPEGDADPGTHTIPGVKAEGEVIEAPALCHLLAGAVRAAHMSHKDLGERVRQYLEPYWKDKDGDTHDKPATP